MRVCCCGIRAYTQPICTARPAGSRCFVVCAVSCSLLWLQPKGMAELRPWTHRGCIEYQPQGAMHFMLAAGDLFVPVVGDGIHPARASKRNGSATPARKRQRS